MKTMDNNFNTTSTTSAKKNQSHHNQPPISQNSKLILSILTIITILSLCLNWLSTSSTTSYFYDEGGEDGLSILRMSDLSDGDNPENKKNNGNNYDKNQPSLLSLVTNVISSTTTSTTNNQDDDDESVFAKLEKSLSSANNNDDDDVHVDVNSTTTTTKHHQEEGPITYKLIDRHKFNNTFDPFYKCDPSKRKSTSKLFHKRHMFDFHVQITTSLHILYMGDSVGIQFSQGLQEATTTSIDDDDNDDKVASSSLSSSSYFKNRHVLRYSWRDHEGLHITSPIRGNGSVAGWRITGMLQRKQMNNDYQMPQTSGGGWMEVDLRNIRRALAVLSANTTTTDTNNTNSNTTTAIHPKCYNALNTTRTIVKVDSSSTSTDQNTNQTSEEGPKCPEKDFDVMIHQFPFGWFTKPVLSSKVSISFNHIHETVMLSHEYFGVKTIILQTIPVGNNLIDFDTELIPINKMIRNYSDTFQYDDRNNSDSSSGIRAVLVMDIGALSMELFKHNAAALGLINITTTTTTPAETIKTSSSHREEQNSQEESLAKQLNPLLDYRTECCHYKYPQIIGFTCAKLVSNFTRHCVRTKYSNDGHHFCLNELGGRIHGAVACLIKCGHDYDFRRMEELKSCERRCNDQYMSLKEIPFNGKRTLENY